MNLVVYLMGMENQDHRRPLETERLEALQQVRQDDQVGEEREREGACRRVRDPAQMQIDGLQAEDFDD